MNDHKEAKIKTHSEDFHWYKFQGNAGRNGVKKLKKILTRQTRKIIRRLTDKEIQQKDE